MTAIRSLTDHALGVGNRDAAEARLNVDDEDDHRQGDDAKQEHTEIADRASLHIMVDRSDVLRQGRNDAGKDDKRDTIADTLRRNLLAHPHEEYRTGRQRDRDDQDVDGVRIQDGFLQANGHADCLEEGEHDGQIARDLRRLLVPLLAFLRPLLEGRDDDIEELDDNGRIDVRRDAHREDGELTERTTGKKVQETEQIAVCEELLDRGRINSRDGDVRPHPEDGEHDQREDDLLAKFGYLKDVAKG